MIPVAVSGNVRIPGVNVPTLKELGVNVTAANWRGVFAAPGINSDQKNKLVNFLVKLNSSPSWKKTVEDRKWTNTFLSGNAFEESIKKDISETEVVLKSLGLA
jgi:putative tricarboxylic transport membrane protein